MTEEELGTLKAVFQFIYGDLFLHYRAVVAVLGNHGVVLSETFEAEVEEWVRQHRDSAGREALQRLDAALLNIARLVQGREEGGE